MACQKGLESTVLVLIQNGVDPNLQTKVTSRRMMMMILDGDDDDIIAVMMIDDDADICMCS